MKKHQRRRPPKKHVPEPKTPMKVSRAAKAWAYQRAEADARLEVEAHARCVESKMPAEVAEEWRRLLQVVATTDDDEEEDVANKALVALEQTYPVTEAELEAASAAILQERHAADHRGEKGRVARLKCSS